MKLNKKDMVRKAGGQVLAEIESRTTAMDTHRIEGETPDPGKAPRPIDLTPENVAAYLGVKPAGGGYVQIIMRLKQKDDLQLLLDLKDLAEREHYGNLTKTILNILKRNVL